MNWRRGLFRIWSAFSILWIGAGFYLLDHGSMQHQISLASEAVYREKILLDNARNANTSVEKPRPPTPAESAAFFEEFFEEHRAYIAAERRLADLEREYKQMSIWVYGPALMLLLLGISFLWVRAGFEKKGTS